MAPMERLRVLGRVSREPTNQQMARPLRLRSLRSAASRICPRPQDHLHSVRANRAHASAGLGVRIPRLRPHRGASVRVVPRPLRKREPLRRLGSRCAMTRRLRISPLEQIDAAIAKALTPEVPAMKLGSVLLVEEGGSAVADSGRTAQAPKSDGQSHSGGGR